MKWHEEGKVEQVRGTKLSRPSKVDSRECFSQLWCLRTGTTIGSTFSGLLEPIKSVPIATAGHNVGVLAVAAMAEGHLHDPSISWIRPMMKLSEDGFLFLPGFDSLWGTSRAQGTPLQTQ